MIHGLQTITVNVDDAIEVDEVKQLVENVRLWIRPRHGLPTEALCVYMDPVTAKRLSEAINHFLDVAEKGGVE